MRTPTKPGAGGGGGGGGELVNLFAPMSLAIVTLRREKGASLLIFRKWRLSTDLQIQLFQTGYPAYSSFKMFCVWTEKCDCEVSFCRGK